MSSEEAKLQRQQAWGLVLVHVIGLLAVVGIGAALWHEATEHCASRNALTSYFFFGLFLDSLLACVLSSCLWVA